MFFIVLFLILAAANLNSMENDIAFLREKLKNTADQENYQKAHLRMIELESSEGGIRTFLEVPFPKNKNYAPPKTFAVQQQRAQAQIAQTLYADLEELKKNVITQIRTNEITADGATEKMKALSSFKIGRLSELGFPCYSLINFDSDEPIKYLTPHGEKTSMTPEEIMIALENSTLKLYKPDASDPEAEFQDAFGTAKALVAERALLEKKGSPKGIAQAQQEKTRDPKHQTVASEEKQFEEELKNELAQLSQDPIIQKTSFSARQVSNIAHQVALSEKQPHFETMPVDMLIVAHQSLEKSCDFVREKINQIKEKKERIENEVRKLKADRKEK